MDRHSATAREPIACARDDDASCAPADRERVVRSEPLWPGGQQRWMVLPGDPRAASIARTVVGSACRRWLVAALADSACLCASELATNAVLHVDWRARPVLGRVAWLVVELAGPFLVVEVRDPDEKMPVLSDELDAPEYAESGRGLLMVRTLMKEQGGYFGCTRLPRGGKSVFFALPVSAEAV